METRLGYVRRGAFEDEFFTGRDDEGELLGRTDTMVREVLQNSLDARPLGSNEPVRVRFAFSELDAQLSSVCAAQYLNGLVEHLDAVGNELVNTKTVLPAMRYLVIEDFGTHGLTGDPELAQSPQANAESESFFWFWRNIGLSGKGGSSRGRWGLGKSVFPASSQIDAFFGLTIRADDHQCLLMGQAITKIHRINGVEFVPEAYFHDRTRGGELQLPFSPPNPVIEQFTNDFRLARKNDPGLSIVIPYPRDTLEPEGVLRSVIVHFFVPILKRELIVDASGPGICATRIDGSTIRDNGAFKAETAARAAKDIYPDLCVHFFNGNVIYDLGMGVFRWADVVFGGLDNREARLAINRNCWRVNRPWIDGAIEQIQGCARVFVPDGPCYECTMSAIDWEVLQQRRSCNLLTKQEMKGGKTPTTPTISSIIAGVQCQEAVKLLHGLETIRGKGWVFEGLSGDSYQIEYQRKEDCYSHETFDEVVALDVRSAQITVRQFCNEVRRLLGQEVTLELGRDMLEKLVCPKCGREEPVFASLGRVGAEKVFCPNCPDTRRDVVTFYKFDGTEPFADRTLSEIGVPPFDIIIARTVDRMVGLELSGDAKEVLGPLFGNEEGVEWA